MKLHYWWYTQPSKNLQQVQAIPQKMLTQSDGVHILPAMLKPHSGHTDAASQIAAEQPTYASRLHCSSAESGSEESLQALLSASASRLDSTCAAKARFSAQTTPKDTNV